MKKKIIKMLITILLMSKICYSQIDTAQWSITINQVDGKYSLLTNRVSMGGVAAGVIKIPIYLSANSIDTNVWVLKRNSSDGKYSIATNRGVLYGIDTGRIVVSIIYSMQDLAGLGLDTTKIPYLSKNNTFTGHNHFSRTYIDTLVLNRIDSSNSSYWYKPNGDLFGFIDASRDSASFLKMYVGSLGTYSIINGSSITTTTLNSDSIVGHSPINLVADSVVAQNKLFAKYIGLNTASTLISRLAIGMADSTVAFNIVRTDKNLDRTTLTQAIDTSSINFRFTTTGKPMFNMKSNGGTNLFSVDSAGNGTMNSLKIGTLRLYDAGGYYTFNDAVYSTIAFLAPTGQFGNIYSGGNTNTNISAREKSHLKIAFYTSNTMNDTIMYMDSSKAITTFGQIKVPNGSSTAPSYSFSGSTNTGIFKGTANSFNITTNGSTRLTIDTAGVTTFTNNIFIPSTKYIYLAGNATTAGSWRMTATLSGDMKIEYTADGNTWTAKATYTP